MNDRLRPPGKTTIAPDVLTSIARLTTLGVTGVSHLAAIPGDVNRIFKGALSDGVRITVENNTVYADIFVVLNRDVNILEVSRAIQAQVARAISEMVGMDVGMINIHVEDIDYPSRNETVPV